MILSAQVGSAILSAQQIEQRNIKRRLANGYTERAA